MKNLIKKIIKEETDYTIIKRIVTKSLEAQVKSGLTPMINLIDLRRKGLSGYDNEIFQIYHEFVGGIESAFNIFNRFIEGKIITEDDIKHIGFEVHQDDHYKVKITGIFNPDYRIIGTNHSLEFGFDIIDGQFMTDEGLLTYEELMDEKYDDIFFDVTNTLRYELENYVGGIAQNNFGLVFFDCTSNWDD